MSSTPDTVSVNDNTTAPSPKKFDATTVTRQDVFGTQTEVVREVLVLADWYDGTDDGMAHVEHGKLAVFDSEIKGLLQELLVEVRAYNRSVGVNPEE